MLWCFQDNQILKIHWPWFPGPGMRQRAGVGLGTPGFSGGKQKCFMTVSWCCWGKNNNWKALNKCYYYLELQLSWRTGKKTCFVCDFCLCCFIGNLTCHLPKFFRCHIFPAACHEMSVIPWKCLLSHVVYHQTVVKFPSLTEKAEFARI